jgi:hypothetical protein
MMRSVVAAEYTTLDGVMEDPGRAEDYEHGGSSNAYFNDDLANIGLKAFRLADAATTSTGVAMLTDVIGKS